MWRGEAREGAKKSRESQNVKVNKIKFQIFLVSTPIYNTFPIYEKQNRFSRENITKNKGKGLVLCFYNWTGFLNELLQRYKTLVIQS